MLQALQQQMSELETKLVQARTDSKAQVKGHNSGKKELEVHVLPFLHVASILHGHCICNLPSAYISCVQPALALTSGVEAPW